MRPRFTCTSRRLRHRPLRLLQPQAHLHLAVHRGRGREVVAGLVGVADSTAEPAEAEVAVSDEGAHPQLAGERERVTVVAVGVSGGVTLSCDVTEDPESPGFIWTLTALAGEGQGSPGERQSIVEAAGEKVCLAQIRQGEWPERRVADGLIGA